MNEVKFESSRTTTSALIKRAKRKKTRTLFISIILSHVRRYVNIIYNKRYGI